jgi:hypothetical protein
MKGSVKIMLSFDYSHFEVALSSDEETDAAGVNALRKTAQRLADEAVRQYKREKEAAANRAVGKQQKEYFLQEIKRIERTQEPDRTVRDLAMLKQYQDENWQAQFEDDYDYDDDEDFEADPA